MAPKSQSKKPRNEAIQSNTLATGQQQGTEDPVVTGASAEPNTAKSEAEAKSPENAKTTGPQVDEAENDAA